MKTQGIVLAAGFSSRMGLNKMLFEIEGKYMLKWSIESLLPFCEDVFVILGHDANRIINALSSNHSRISDQVRFIINSSYRSGMYSSVLEGFKYIDGTQVLVLPGDIPFVKKDTIQQILEKSGPVRIPSFQNHSGHPILLEKAVVKGELCLKVETLRALIKHYEITYVPVDDKRILMDFDTFTDFEQYRNEVII